MLALWSNWRESYEGWRCHALVLQEREELWSAMCGLVGGWEMDVSVTMHERLMSGLTAIRHRGPDDIGEASWTPRSGSMVALGSTRLSILDLTLAGHMPMVSADGRFVLAYNGEITNYIEVRETLLSEGRLFRSGTDTEVLLQAWEAWGPDSLSHFEGLFAFSILDKKLSTLTLVRDPFGIKPLYYSYSEGASLYYSSEVPGLIEMMATRPKLNWQVAYDYLRWASYDGGAEGFIEGVEQLQPAHYLTIDLRTGIASSPIRYWWPSVVVDRSVSLADATDQVRELFLDSVLRNLRSDVPVGVALSGGIDSSAIACSIRHLEPDYDLQSFSYIVPGFDYSEEKWVNRVVADTQARGHIVTPTAADLANDLDDMIRTQGEPFGSTSIYAQYRVFKLARQHGVVVTLDGQGADEAFAGYSGYPEQRLRSLIEKGQWVRAGRFLNEWKAWPNHSARSVLIDTASQFVPEVVSSVLHRMSMRRSPLFDYGLLAERGIRTNFPRIHPESEWGNRLKPHMRSELFIHGLPALLRHGDRNSMRFSVESRVPFLDRRLVEYVLSLPEEYLVAPDGASKSILRHAMRGIVPNEILDRRDKIGFVTPEKAWLGGLLRDVAQPDSEATIAFLRRGERERELIASSPEEALGLGPRAHWRLVNLQRWVSILGIDAN